MSRVCAVLFSGGAKMHSGVFLLKVLLLIGGAANKSLISYLSADKIDDANEM